mgnify:CR=1 FL=1
MKLTTKKIKGDWVMVYKDDMKLESVDVKQIKTNYGSMEEYLQEIRDDLEGNQYYIS